MENLRKQISTWCRRHKQMHLFLSIHKVHSSYEGKEGTTYMVERKNSQGKIIDVILNLYKDGTFYAETIWVPDLSKERIIGVKHGQ